MKIGTATVVLMVMLRMGLGCHFFYEGVWKIEHPEFSAEGFLSMAKGPAAWIFHAFLPDQDGRQRLKIEKTVSTDALVAGWRKVRIDSAKRLAAPYAERLKLYRVRIIKYEEAETKEDKKKYELTDADKETMWRLERKIHQLTVKLERETDQIQWEAEDKLEAFVAKNERAILAYFATPPGKRSAEQVTGWLTQIGEFEKEYLQALSDYAEQDKEFEGLEEELEVAILRSVADLKKSTPAFDGSVPVEDLVSNSGIKGSGPKKSEVLKVTSRIRADKFYKPYNKLRRDVIKKYRLDAEQRYQADKTYRRYKEAAKTVLDDNQEDIATYFMALDRCEKHDAIGNDGAAHQIERGYDERKKLRKEVGVWLTGLEKSGEGYQDAMADLLTGQQAARGPLPVPWKLADYIDFAVKYGLTAIGLCLLLGLFTRPAALAGACFMISVVLTQPAWPTIYPPGPPTAGHALLINKDFIEMLVLFTLATTAVGRWAGLDYFVENFVISIYGKLKDKSNQQEDKS